MSNPKIAEVPDEISPELVAVIRLDPLNRDRQPPTNLFDEGDANGTVHLCMGKVTSYTVVTAAAAPTCTTRVRKRQLQKVCSVLLRGRSLPDPRTRLHAERE
jgi:hypothetical protein